MNIATKRGLVSGMAGMLARRLGVSLLVLWLVSVLVYLAMLLLPGDPARAILGQSATPARIAALRERLNLDEPAFLQYLHWLGGLLRGDLGTSAASGGPVNDLLGDRIVASLVLMGLAALVSTPVAIALGVWSARRRDRAPDHLVSGATLVLAAIPEFVVGIVLIVLLSTTVLRVLPSVTLTRPGDPVWSAPAQLVLPVLALALAVTPYVIRMMRSMMIEVLDSGYVEMARLKGVPETRLLWRHALPHAIGPVAQVIALQLAWLAGGVVVIEFLFRYPGVGQALIDAVNNRDVQVVQAITFLIAAVYVLVNLLADVTGLLADPRLRTRSAT